VPAGGTKLGDAYIAVTADASAVGRDLEAKIDRSLGKVVDSYDKALGKVERKARETGQKVSDSLGDEVARKAKPAAERAAGAFGDAFAKRLRAAMADLPDIQIRADSSDADHAITGIRRQMETLGSKRLGVDVSTGDALLELGAIEHQLRDLAGSTSDVAVRADAAAAIAELAAVRAEVDALDGKNADVKVDVDDGGSAARATSSIGGLIAAGIGIGSAIIPAAAAAALAIAGIGAAAGGAAAGLGVIALGFSGVGDAVKLLGQQQTAQAAAATQAAGKQSASAAALASAQRGLESAEAGLANTRANAADSAAKAARTVTDARAAEVRAEQDGASAIDAALRKLSDARDQAAKDADRAGRAVAQAEAAASTRVQTALDRQETAERALTVAQKAQQQAQEDLTGARKDAEQQLEDLANRVTDNALDQRQAVLDVADAQAELNKTMADPKADAAARAQAQLRYEQQVQSQKELRLAGQRLVEQQKEEAAKGVDGSDQVTAAQQQLVDAQQRVTDGVKDVGAAAADVDAARVEGAEKIALAQQALADSQVASARKIGDAEAAVGKAREDGARKVEAAQRAISDAVAAQATQQRQSAFSISQAQGGVAGAMAAVATAAAGSGDAGSNALARINAELDKVSPSTRRFAEFVDGTLRPAWKRLQDTAAAGILPGVQTGLEGLLSQEGRITGFVDAFATSAGKLLQGTIGRLSDPTWTRFFDTLQTQGVPQFEALWHAGENIAEALGAIWTAFAPLGTEMATGIEDLTGKFLTWSQQFGGSDGFHQFTEYVRTNWPLVKEIIGNVAEIIGNVVVAGAGIGQALLPSLALLTDVLAALPVPVVAALLTAFLGYKTLTGVSGVIDGVTGAIGRLSGQTGAAQGALAGIGGAAEGAAGKVGKLSGAASGVLAAFGGPWGIAIAGASALVGAVGGQMEKASAQTDAWATAIANGTLKSEDFNTEYQKQFGGKKPDWLGHVAEWLGLASSMDEAKTKAEGMRGKQAELDTATQAATTALDAEKASLDGLTGSTVDADTAEANYWASVDQAKASVEGLTGQVDQATGKFDLHTDSGRNAQAALLGMRDAGNDLIQKMIEQGATSDQVVAKDAQLRQTFIDTATQMGMSQEQARTYADQILGIPAERTTQITADTADATQAAADLQKAIDNLKGRTLTVALNTMEVAPGRFQQQYRTANGGLALGVAYEHDGGIVHAYAKGGIEPKAMRGGIAQVVKPNTWRVIGDRVRDDEAYIPINTSARSMSILDQTARRMGLAVVNPDVPHMAEGGLILGAALTRRKEVEDEITNYASRFALDTLTRTAAEAAAAGAAQAAGKVAAGAGGGLTGAWRSVWDVVHAAIPQARINSTFRAGDPGYHGKGKAIDFGFGSGPGGNGSAGLASIARFLYSGFGKTLAELIYDGAYDDTPDVKNGRDHTYNAQTRKDHHNHVHAAVYDGGGMLLPGMAGLNLSNAPEPVFTGAQWQVLESNLRPALTGDTGVAGQVIGYLMTSSTALTRIAEQTGAVATTLGAFRELVDGAITEATDARAVAADVRWKVLVTLRELSALLAEVALMTETIGKAQAVAQGLDPGTVTLARSDADKFVVLERAGLTAAALAAKAAATATATTDTATTADGAGADAESTASMAQFAFDNARARARQLEAAGDVQGAIAAHEAAAAVYVTYSPTLTVPTVPTAGQAAAILEQDLARSLRMGLLNAQIGEVAW
jgi:hypothetical protein